MEVSVTLVSHIVS